MADEPHPAARSAPSSCDLARAQHHVDEGILRLAEQRIRVEKEGQPLLGALEDTLQIMVAHRDEIEAAVNSN